MKSFHYKFHYELVIKARGDYHGLKMIVGIFFSNITSPTTCTLSTSNSLIYHNLLVREESNMKGDITCEKKKGTRAIKAKSVFEGSVVSKRI